MARSLTRAGCGILILVAMQTFSELTHRCRLTLTATVLAIGVFTPASDPLLGANVAQGTKPAVISRKIYAYKLLKTTLLRILKIRILSVLKPSLPRRLLHSLPFFSKAFLHA